MNNSSSSSSYFNDHQHLVFSQPSYYQSTSATDFNPEDYPGPNDIGTDTKYSDCETPLLQDTGGWVPAPVNTLGPPQQSFSFQLEDDLPEAAYGAIRDHPSSDAYNPSWTAPRYLSSNGIAGHGAGGGPQSSGVYRQSQLDSSQPTTTGPSWPMSHYPYREGFAQPTGTLSAPAANARCVAPAASHHSNQSYPPSRPANNHSMYHPPAGLDGGQNQRMVDPRMHHLNYTNVSRHQLENTQPASRYTGNMNVSQPHPNSYAPANNNISFGASNVGGLNDYLGQINPGCTSSALRQPQHVSGMVNPTYSHGQPPSLPNQDRYMSIPGQSQPGVPNLQPNPSNGHDSHIRAQPQSPSDTRLPNYHPRDTAAFQNGRPPPPQPPRAIDRNPRPQPPSTSTPRPYACPYCGQSRRSAKELQTHTDDMHGTATTHYVCIDCDNAGKVKEFTRPHRVKEHCEKVHRHSPARENVHYRLVPTARTTEPNRRNNEARGAGHRR